MKIAHIAITPKGVREANQFSWAPMHEVAKLFIGIFLTMVPVLAILKAGEAGAFAAVARAVTGPDGQPLPWAYFWFSGTLSSFLDNAPTYLVFFNLAGGDPAVLMTTLAPTLAAVYERRGFTPALEAALDTFLGGLLDCNVIVGDMHAWNIVLGSDSRGGPRLVMIDGFGEKHAIPLSSINRAINRYRTRRLYRRMLAQLERLVPIQDRD